MTDAVVTHSISRRVPIAAAYYNQLASKIVFEPSVEGHDRVPDLSIDLDGVTCYVEAHTFQLGGEEVNVFGLMHELHESLKNRLGRPLNVVLKFDRVSGLRVGDLRSLLENAILSNLGQVPTQPSPTASHEIRVKE